CKVISQMRMKISVIGTISHFEECRQKLGEHQCILFESHADYKKLSDDRSDLIIDFLIAGNPEALRIYKNKSMPVFLNSVNSTLLELVRKAGQPLTDTMFGFNGFPTMFNR